MEEWYKETCKDKIKFIESFLLPFKQEDATCKIQAIPQYTLQSVLQDLMLNFLHFTQKQNGEEILLEELEELDFSLWKLIQCIVQELMYDIQSEILNRPPNFVFELFYFDIAHNIRNVLGKGKTFKHSKRTATELNNDDKMMNELYVMNADKEKVEVDQLKTLILFVMKYFPNAAEFRQRIQNIVEGSEAIQVITTMCEILRERDKLLSKKINREQICKNYIESTKEFTNSTAQEFFKRHLSFANPPILYEFLKDNYFVFCKYPKLMVKTDIKTDKHLIGNIEKSLLRKVDPTKYIQYSEINNFFKTSYESTQKLEHNNIIPDIDSNHKGGKDIKRMEHNKTIINDNPFNYSPNTKNEEKIIVKTEQELWNDKNLEETRPISVAKRVLNSDISPSVSPSKANIKIPSAKVDKRMMDVTEKLVREQPVEEYKVIEQKNVPIGGRPVLYYPPVEEEEPDLPGEEEEPEPDIPDEEIYHISTPLFENHQKPSLPDYPKITIRYKTGEIIQSVSQTDAILTNNHITFGKDVKCNIRIKSEKVQNVQGEILYNGVDGKFYMKCLSENNLTLYKVQTDTRVKLRRNNYFTLGEQVAFSIGDLQEESPDPILSPNISDQLFDPRPMLAPTYSQHSQIRIIEDINGGSDITIVGSGKGNVEREYVFGVSAFADYQLIKREGISNKHFRIGYSRGFGWYILDGIPDKGSTNGTYLAIQNYDTCIDNAQPFLLHGQMEFQIGDLALLVEEIREAQKLVLFSVQAFQLNQ